MPTVSKSLTGAGHRDSLEQVLSALEKIDPKEPTADCIRLALLDDEGQREEFLAGAKSILERPDLTAAARAWPLRQRAMFMIDRGDFDSALEDAHEALRLDPANYFNPYVLAKIHQKVHQLDKALIYAQQSIALSPCFEAFVVTSDILKEMGREHESIDYATEACEAGNRASYCARLALRLLRSGREAEARRIVAKLATIPETSGSAYDLACFYALTGDRTGAIQQLRRSLELGPAPQGFDEDVDLLSLHGDAEFERLVADVRRKE